MFCIPGWPGMDWANRARVFGVNMKTKPRDKNSPSSKPAAPCRQNNSLKSEWPLLVYPVLVVAALGILYGVNRSIQKELAPASSGPRVETSGSTGTVAEGTDPKAGTADGSSTSVDVGVAQTIVADADQEQASIATTDAAETNAQSAGNTGFEELQGTARVLAMLRQALKTGNDTEIKQCMGELVALGDDAVGPLNEAILSGKDATALWAAEALARIGTPAATSALLDTLAQTKEGPYKEQLAKRTSNISNHDSWPVLLDTLQDTTDAAVLRAASVSLSKMADRPVVDEIVARYDAATTEEEATRLAQMVGNINSPAASESLLALAGSVSSVPQDALQTAAIDALANVGDAQCVSYLLRKLEASPPGEETRLFNSITTISQPQAEAALQYAAAGNKEVSAEHGRTAAIYALENFPDEQTCVLLERIVATEENTRVVSAAARTLENIRKAEPVVAASATAKVDEQLLLPTNPLQK